MRTFASTNSLPFMQVVSCPADFSARTQVVSLSQVLQHSAPRLGVAVFLICDLTQSLGDHCGYRRVLFGGHDLELTQEVFRNRYRDISRLHAFKCSTCLRALQLCYVRTW